MIYLNKVDSIAIRIKEERATKHNKSYRGKKKDMWKKKGRCSRGGTSTKFPVNLVHYRTVSTADITAMNEPLIIEE